jgi:hypothetical protein
MNVIFYLLGTGDAREWMNAVITMMPVQTTVELYRNIGSLAGRLRWPSEGLTIAILMAEDSEDLANIISIRDLLFEIPLILILPDRAPDVTAAGFRLLPRFLTYADGDKLEVGAVLEKMYANYKKNRGGWGDIGAGSADIQAPNSILAKLDEQKEAQS